MDNICKKVIKYLTNEKYRFEVNRAYGMYRYVSDEKYLKKAFKISLGYPLDLDDPKTFNEKMQWLKLHDRKPVYTTMVDKYAAKEYVAGIIGEEHIIPTIGVWERFEDIDFSKLPDQFVLKCTHDSGGLVICRDKAKLDIEAARRKINKCLKMNYYWQGREWPYKNVKPRIIAEQYMEDSGTSEVEEDKSFAFHGEAKNRNTGLTDYKFFCFNGELGFLYVSRGLEHHPTAEISFYDMNGKEMAFHRNDFRQYHNAKMPDNFSEMKEVAIRLAEKVDSPFVRIDLYSIQNKVYFSEITFSPCGGMIPFEPSSADAELGQRLVL